MSVQNVDNSIAAIQKKIGVGDGNVVENSYLPMKCTCNTSEEALKDLGTDGSCDARIWLAT